MQIIDSHRLKVRQGGDMVDRPVALVPQVEVPVSGVLADKWIRVAGYLIDVAPTLLLLFVVWIPVFGLIAAGLCLLPYWLLRDVTGASLGKLLLGLKVVRRDGRPASVGARILRNVPLTFAPACMILPLLGYVFAGPVAAIVVLIEGIMLLSQGERLGDRIAGTTVTKR
jgi:uncharacterized RDD family membrane protein YckC